MTKRILCLLAAAGIAAPQFVGAVNYLDWADEFISARITCENNACTTFGYFNGDGPTFVARPWWYIGRQGTDAQGRANARERSNFIFTDNATGTCSTQTLQLARYRTATCSPPLILQRRPSLLVLSPIRPSRQVRMLLADRFRVRHATRSSGFDVWGLYMNESTCHSGRRWITQFQSPWKGSRSILHALIYLGDTERPVG